MAMLHHSFCLLYVLMDTSEFDSTTNTVTKDILLEISR